MGCRWVDLRRDLESLERGSSQERNVSRISSRDAGGYLDRLGKDDERVGFFSDGMTTR